MDHLTTIPQPVTITPGRNAPARQFCTRGPLISVDGITGVGKDCLTSRAVKALDDEPLTLGGFSERVNRRADLGILLLRALKQASVGDPFLRGGTPMAETLLLMAIKRHDLDTVLPHLASGHAVIEGRGVDTTAVCQALVLHPDNPDAALNTAKDLLDLASSYRPLPDLTILVTDDPSEAIARAQRRDRCVFTTEQTAFMTQACLLYEQLATTDPARYRIIDRRSSDEHTAAEKIRTWIQDVTSDLTCLNEPWQAPGAPCTCCGKHAATESR